MSRFRRPALRAFYLSVAAIGAVTVASAASAGCGDMALQHPAAWGDERSAGGLEGLLHRSSEEGFGNHSIVGMWSFKMSAGGGYSDFGYQQWHSDGTEFMNSGGRAPATQNYCLGVWRQVGPSRYHLNHFALSYDNSGTLNGRVNIKEDVTLDRGGTSYSGAFTIDIYDPTGTTAVAHVAGQVTAQRVPAN